MTTNQTAPTIQLPEEIEAAIKALGRVNFCRTATYGEYYDAEDELRHAILAALEPERSLRERCERLRLSLIEALDHVHTTAYLSMPYTSGDLADDLTATSSADEGRRDDMVESD